MGKVFGLILLNYLAFQTASASEGQWNIPVTGQIRVFPNIPQYTGQSYNNHSLAIKPKYEKSFENSALLRIEPFYRWDDQDNQRTHGDIREFSYISSWGNARIKVGISKIFWGVTETQHLVDIVNQTDFVESADSTEKLGQPMIHWNYLSDYGNWDFLLLIGFRERTFPGVQGRLRTPAPVDYSFTERVKTSDLDFALRWSQRFDQLDLGLSTFWGNSRDPVLRPNNLMAPTYFIATYDEIFQAGLDTQYTFESIIWKLEAIYREGFGSPAIIQSFGTNPNNFSALTAGGEYTLGSFKGTELATLFEYSYDSRQPQIVTKTLPVYAIFQNDYFLGFRWTLNDAFESNLFLGAAIDADSQASTISLRYNRRIYDNLSLSFRSLTLTNVPDPAPDPYAAVQNDSFFEVNITKYYLF